MDKQEIKGLIKEVLEEILAEKNQPEKKTKTRSKTKEKTETPKRPDLETFIVNKKTGSKKNLKYNDKGEVIGSYGRSEEVKFVQNMFEDDGTIASSERKETETIKNKLESGSLKKREKRQPAQMVEVKCQKCNKVLTVFKSSVFSSYYICNSCARKQ